ncbi:ComEC family competence protein [Omnitrophica bacterium]|nr:ComEC family competence protein [Candidatus Omnitrophota bacterium]
MNKSPLTGIAIAFIIGILIARYTDIPFILFWIAALLSLGLGVLFLRTRRRFLSLLILTIVFLGGAAFRNSQTLPPNHISNFTPHKGVKVYVEGIIDSDPVEKTRYASFILKTERLLRRPDKVGTPRNDIRVYGKVLVKIFGRQGFRYGDRLYMEGTIYKAPYFRISKRLNYRDYLENTGIYSVLSAGKDSTVKILERGRGNPLKAFCYCVRHRIKEMIEDNSSPFSAGVLNAIILGERHDLARSLREVLVQSGTVHIIAISGLHVGLVSFIILMALKIFRIPRRLCYVITPLLLIAYCILTGARTPVVRVTLMALIIFFGYIIDRRTNIYNTLSIAALLILSYNPHQLFSVSFQLSFVSIISLVGLSPRIKSFFFTKDRPKPRIRLLIELFSASLAAWIGLLPLIGYYFNIISPIAILANMIVVPYLSIVVGTGLLAVMVGSVFPVLAYTFFAANELSIIALIKFVSILVRIPGSYFYIPCISMPFLMFYYLSVAVIALLMDSDFAKSGEDKSRPINN